MVREKLWPHCFLMVSFHCLNRWGFSVATDEQGGEKMLKSMLSCCKVYISESRNKVAVESIE